MSTIRLKADGTLPSFTEIFGDSPFVSKPGGKGPLGPYEYNEIYFATQATAQIIADTLGGTVEEAEAETPSVGSPFKQNQKNFMVRMPMLPDDQASLDNDDDPQDNLGRPIDPKGRLVVAGKIAELFKGGQGVDEINRLISEEIGKTFTLETEQP